MGTRILFWLGSEDGIVGRFSTIIEPFVEWLALAYEEFPDEFSFEAVALSRALLTDGLSVLRATTSHEAWVSDRIIDYLILFNAKYPFLDDASMSSLYASHYETISEALKRQHVSSKVIQLWQFLFDGRPVLRDVNAFPYQPDDEIFRLSYWTAEETKFLRPVIEQLENVEARAKNATLEAMQKAISRSVGLIMMIG